MALENQQNPPFEALDGSNRDHGAVGGSTEPEWAVDDLGVTEEGEEEEEEARGLLVAGGGRAGLARPGEGCTGVARQRRWPGGAVEEAHEGEEGPAGVRGSPRMWSPMRGRPDQGEPNPNPRREALIPC